MVTFISNAQSRKARSTSRAIHLRHTVQPGETFRSIARLYGLTSQQVADYNNLEFYEEEVLARFLTIPLTSQNFSSTPATGTDKILVPVFRVNGSSERTVRFKKRNGRGTNNFSVVYNNSRITSKISNNLQAAGYLLTARENEKVFKTYVPKDLTTEIVASTDTASNNTASITQPVAPVFDTLSKSAQPVAAKPSPAIAAKKVVKPLQSIIKSKSIPRASSRLERVLVLVKLQVAITIVLVILIFLAMMARNQAEVNRTNLNGTLRKVLVEEILAEPTFSDSINKIQSVSPYLRKKIAKKASRQFVIDELVNGRKNIKGEVGEKFLELYLTLNLEQDSCKKLKSHNWNDVAKGIQELTVMDQQHKMAEIFTEINSTNEYIRMEAQSALVHLSGFGGLWFLNVLNYSMSEWQQMKLIKMLAASQSAEFPDVHTLLTSPNNSLVKFTLKLIAEFQQRTMHQAVVKCLHHRSEEIRFAAIQCLARISNPDTADQLVRRFASETRKNKLAILKVIGEVGESDHTHFLLHHLQSNDDTVKISAARALNRLGKVGSDSLEEFCHGNGDQYTNILLHIKSEKTYDMV